MRETRLALLAGQLLNQPALASPQTLEVLAALLQAERERDAEARKQGRRLRPAPRPQNWRYADNRAGLKIFRQDGKGNAIIRVFGLLVTRGAWVENLEGVTSYEGICAQLAAARDDPSVVRIILDIDSPGGAWNGSLTTVEAVRSTSTKKPVIAVVDSQAAGAAALLTSAATKVLITEFGTIGGLGVSVLHEDHSRRLEAEGIKATEVQAGARKTAGSPLRPLSEQDGKDLQAEVDQIYDLLVSTVAQGRGLSQEAIRALGARTFRGREAIAAGLADALGTLETAKTTTPERKPQIRPPAVPGAPAAVLDCPVRAAERARVKAILEFGNEAGRSELARNIAFKTSLPLKEVKILMKEAPG